MVKEKDSINRNGAIIYEGKSIIDGGDIVGIITGLGRSSKNPKTGNMSQIWILNRDETPLAAHTSDKDISICGHCPYRKDENGHRICYVNIGQAPTSIYHSYINNKYQSSLKYTDIYDRISTKGLRLGAYGDPVAIPHEVIKPYIDAAPYHTAYTHQWREDWAQSWKSNVMASCETLDDLKEANDRGWKSFRIVVNAEDAQDNEIVCPNIASGKKITCAQCRKCDGRHENIVVPSHGVGSKYFKEKKSKK